MPGMLAAAEALVEIDEVRLGDQIRAEILDVLEGPRSTLALALKARHGTIIDAEAAPIEARLGRHPPNDPDQ
jgi:hypothetical protein